MVTLSKSEVGQPADAQKQQCLEEKRQEKAFEQAMLESPMGGIYEAQAAAEPASGEPIITKTVNSEGSGFETTVVEVLKSEFFTIAPYNRCEATIYMFPS